MLSLAGEVAFPFLRPEAGSSALNDWDEAAPVAGPCLGSTSTLLILPAPTLMADIPDDLTDVGAHHGNQPPPDTGQTVRSPTGPDPEGTDARPSPALFQVVRTPSENRLTVHAHSARAEVAAHDEGEEVGQYRTVAALRDALADEGIEEGAAVFEDAEAGRVLVETEVAADHAWVGQSRYPTITFFESAEEARAFADTKAA